MLVPQISMVCTLDVIARMELKMKKCPLLKTDSSIPAIEGFINDATKSYLRFRELFCKVPSN